ncbi:hypothetical protein ABFS83_08G013300 [Erythranthe nasuta]
MSKTHIAVFPFMSKGHIIPLLHLSRLLLLRRGVAITIFTTPATHPFISQLLSDDDVTITTLPFPENILGIPPGTESTDKLPSMSLFVPFVNAAKLMQPSFEEALMNINSSDESHPISCIISDGFLPWTLQTAARLGVPRLSFYGMGHYAVTLSRDAAANGSLSLHESGDEPFNLVGFPRIQLTRNEFNDPFDKPDPTGPHLDFIIEAITATNNSFGLLVNSFYELEQPFADYWTRHCEPKAWSIGPLCLAAAPPPKAEPSPSHNPKWIQWLDRKSAQGDSVLYVAFGSQAKIPPPQLREIAAGLAAAETSFLWVLKKSELPEFDLEKLIVSERGMLVDEWVDQRQILEHPAVEGFLSHCGWNSVLEGICAGVPIVAWPMMAEQFLNAKFVAEEIRVGSRVKTVDGSAKGFISRESLKNAVVELMEGQKGKEMREKVKEVAEAARKSMAEGGSSSLALDNLVDAIRSHNNNTIKISP